MIWLKSVLSVVECEAFVEINDDLLIKMAALAQRAMQTVSSDGSLTISDEEKEQLLSAMNELKGDK